jgi:hypothetical protein
MCSWLASHECSAQRADAAAAPVANGTAVADRTRSAGATRAVVRTARPIREIATLGYGSATERHRAFQIDARTAAPGAGAAPSAASARPRRPILGGGATLTFRERRTPRRAR